MLKQNLSGNLAVRGFDLVAYFEGEARMGDPAISAEHGEATYYFASKANRAKFEASPNRYLPAYGGWCAYAMSEGKQFDVDPRSFKVVNGRLYLFYDGVGGRTIDFWNENEASRLKQAAENWQEA